MEQSSPQKLSWSNELFTIHNLCKTYSTTYLLKDEKGNTIIGKFYFEELQKMNHPNTYLIEKVLKKMVIKFW